MLHSLRRSDYVLRCREHYLRCKDRRKKRMGNMRMNEWTNVKVIGNPWRWGVFSALLVHLQAWRSSSGGRHDVKVLIHVCQLLQPLYERRRRRTRDVVILTHHHHITMISAPKRKRRRDTPCPHRDIAPYHQSLKRNRSVTISNAISA